MFANEFSIPQGMIPEFDKGKLVGFLTSRRFQNSFNGIISRTRKSGFEQALTVYANAKTESLSAKESKSSTQYSIERSFEKQIEKGLRPLVAVHTHAAETKFDPEGRVKYYDGTYFLPSPDDMETPHVFDEKGRKTIDLVEAMIVTTSIPRVWIWQVASDHIQRLASNAVYNYFQDISRNITESDILELVRELKGVGLRLHYGNLDSRNPAKSFADTFVSLGFHTGFLRY